MKCDMTAQISLEREWHSEVFDMLDSPRRHRGQQDYYWWEPPFGLLNTVVGKDREGARPWWEARNLIFICNINAHWVAVFVRPTSWRFEVYDSMLHKLSKEDTDLREIQLRPLLKLLPRVLIAGNHYGREKGSKCRGRNPPSIFTTGLVHFLRWREGPSCGRALHVLLAREISILGAPNHEFGPSTFDMNLEYDLSNVGVYGRFCGDRPIAIKDLLEIFKDGHVNGANDDDYLKIWAYEAIPEFGQNVAKKDKLNRLHHCLRWFFVRSRAIDFHGLLNMEIGCHETLIVEKAEQERPYWNIIHCAELIGVLFLVLSNPVVSHRDPDQKPSKHKRAREIRSFSLSSGDYDRRASSLAGKIKDALMPDIINYLKHDLIGDMKNALLLDLKEFIKILKCGSRRSTSHHSPHCRSPIQDRGSAESHHSQPCIWPSPIHDVDHDQGSHHSHHPEMPRRSLHVDDAATHGPRARDIPRRSLQLDSCRKPRQRPHDRGSLQVEDFWRTDVALPTHERSVNQEVNQADQEAEPSAPNYNEKRPHRMKKTSMHLSLPFLSQAPPTLSLILKTNYIQFRKFGPRVSIQFANGLPLQMAFFVKLEDYNSDMQQEMIEMYTPVMQNKLLRGQHILSHITANNTRILAEPGNCSLPQLVDGSHLKSLTAR
ncbi:hypothetical protein C2S53_000030 [Perilla frutescens var. hirtella]|uniref:Ubiquitin-like protease family profile domain-containing protein n=1 Tax=Perilla frutescens var. hirtella TaxID=608512 RepID=A0AAD4PFI6_PERFH|nr:hypothetical protein C2S53_000030 [Perilla frutescens var. hirtella]